MRNKGGMVRRALAFALAVLTTVGVALAPPVAAYAEDGAVTMGHLVAGDGNGKAHFGQDNAAAFVLSDQTYGDGTVSADLYVNSDPAKSNIRFVGKYVDDQNWYFVGHDVDDKFWILQYRSAGMEKPLFEKLSGLPAPSQGKKTSVSVANNDGTINVTVNGSTVAFKKEGVAEIIAGLMAQDGKVGVGAGKYNSGKTDVYFTNVVAGGGSSLTDFSGWTVYQSGKGETWQPSAAFTPVYPEGRKWIQITGGKNNGGGHAYGDPAQSAPAALLAKNVKTKPADTISLTLTPMTDDINFGVFYTYVDDTHFTYVGYDKSSGWYCQYINGSDKDYPKFGGSLPTPKKGEPLEISISVANEAVNLTVGDQTSQQPWQVVGNLVSSVSGKGCFGVKVNNQTSVKFADAKVNENNIMEEEWSWAAARDGQLMEETYVNLSTVTGTVKNASEAPLEGATVRVGTQVVKTNDQGEYTAEDVEVGTQTITASYPGYVAQSKQLDVKNKEEAASNVCDFTLQEKPEVDLSSYKTISSDKMKVYVSDKFPQVVRYEFISGSNAEKFFRGQETLDGINTDITTLKVNGVEVAPEVQPPNISGDTATYTMTVTPSGDNKVNAVFTVEVKIADADEGSELSWKITDIKKNNDEPIKSIDISNMNLLSLDQVDAGQGFAGAQMSNNVDKSGDKYYSFDGAFNPNSSEGFMYAFLSSKDLSAGIFSNSEAKGDKRITLNSGTDTMGLTSSVWYYEQGDDGKDRAQDYLTKVNDVKDFPDSELPWVKVAIADGDVNEDGAIDWNDGAVATRDILNTPYGSEDMKDLVGYRIVMNFGSEVSNPYALTADNLKKVSLLTDGLPQALLLKGYGNEGHDSANSEYADISEKEGGTKGFQDLIKVAHQYNTQVGIHVNAQEAYPESKSYTDRTSQNMGTGWNWLDQSTVIDKYWDLGSGARWDRFVQLYDRINGTSFANKNFEKGEYVGNPAESLASAASMEKLAADAKDRTDNMDFIYLDVWYQDSWETRRIAEQINSLGWRFSTEFPYEGEYDSTWSHWATDVPYGGSTTKGINSDIVRFLRNDQRDTSPNNHRGTPGVNGVMDNPLLGGLVLDGFEGWGGDKSLSSYIDTTYTENLPTRFLQHYQVVDWTNYGEGESPVGNHEKEIVLKNGTDKVVVTRHQAQRSDDVCEREITLNGTKVLDDAAYLLPWTTDDGEQKLYHYNVDGGSTTWTLLDGWKNQNLTLYKLTDQGRVKVKDFNGTEIPIKAEAKTPYVLVKSDAKADMPTADKVDFGENTGVTDPGFNAYEDGEKLNDKVWSGDVSDDSIKVQKLETGDQVLTISNPAKDVAVSTKLTGLEKDKTYVAEVYVGNESDAQTTIEVTSGKNKASRSMARSITKNNARSNAKAQTYMTRVYVKFTAGADNATLTLRRAKGEGTTYVDNIRYVENADFPVQDGDGDFSQDFEHAVSGLYPFVMGKTFSGGDAPVHLSERNGKYTQTGWRNSEVDDVLGGDWSLKYHNNQNGKTNILYLTTPQNLYFAPGKTYTVEFDYQSGSAANDCYQMVVGNGDPDAEGTYTVPTEFLPATYANGKQQTSHITMEVTGAENGQTWIGLYSKGNNGGSAAICSGDFVLDNLKVTCKDSGGEPEPTPAPGTPGGVASSQVGKDSFTVSWKAPEGGSAVAYYMVYLNGEEVAKLSADELSYTFEGLKAGTDYEVKVVAFDEAGNASEAASLKVTTASDGTGGGTEEGGGSGEQKPEQKPDQKPGDGTGDGSGQKPGDGSGDGADDPDKTPGFEQSGDASGDRLVQTGDNALSVIVPVAAAGVVLVAIGAVVAVKRRKR